MIALSLLTAAQLAIGGLSVAAAPPLTHLQTGPLMYLTLDRAAPVLVLDERGEGKDIFWLQAGQTVQASIHAVVDGQDWLYVHYKGQSGWVKFDYDHMRLDFDYGQTT